MRKRVIGAGILVAIGIGMWLSSLFKGLGPGGDGEGFGTRPGEDSQVSVHDSDIPANFTSPTPPQEVQTPEIAHDPVPIVIIDGHRYLLQSMADQAPRPAELSEIVAAAQAAAPDENGVKLHIKRRSSSRTTAEDALRSALQEADVPSSAVVEHRGFVD